MTHRIVRGVRIAWKSLVLAAMVLAVLPTQLLVLAFTRGTASLVLPALFHGLACRVLGIHVEMTGTATAEPRAVFISNHLSYLDVLVIGGVVHACFVAKEDVRAWPLFGLLSRLQQTVFITRNPRRAALAVERLRQALADGHRLVLFPEGTTSDGRAVLPFKSSSFAALVDPTLAHAVLQPVTVELIEVDGLPVAAGGHRDTYAYHGDATLVPHLGTFMRASGARVRLHFHAPLQRAAQDSRKDLAQLAHDSVAAPLMHAAQ